MKKALEILTIIFGMAFFASMIIMIVEMVLLIVRLDPVNIAVLWAMLFFGLFSIILGMVYLFHCAEDAPVIDDEYMEM